MKGYRFYEEYTDRRKTESTGNVVAIDVVNPKFKSAGGPWCFEAVGAVFNRPNSPCATTGVAEQHLWEKCKRISGKRAREIHPELFAYLEA